MSSYPDEQFLAGRLLDKKRVKQAFNRAVLTYDANAPLQQCVGERLLERLDLFAIAPRTVLDIGSGTGTSGRALARRYRPAEVVMVDLAINMLHYARRRSPRFFNHQRFVCADAEQLPLADASIDLIHSNLTLQWCNDIGRVFAEAMRLLRPTGLLIFTTFGPDTLKELRASWGAIDARTHVHHFIDMHDIGDALIAAGFSSPVMDVEGFTLTYQRLAHLIRDLRAVGATNAASKRPHGLGGKAKLAELERAYERFRRGGTLPASYEVVYGHAWRPEATTQPQDGSTVATFPVERLRRRRAQ